MSEESFVNATGESHDCVVPGRVPNKDLQRSAEGPEGRRSIKENTEKANPSRIQSREIGSRGLHGVREAAKRDKELRFTALLHHVTEGLLRDSFYSLQREAAPGVDRVTLLEYEQGLEARIQDLHGRVHRGAYRAQPSRRVYIPKADGRQHPLGIAALEDKIVQAGGGDGPQRDLLWDAALPRIAIARNCCAHCSELLPSRRNGEGKTESFNSLGFTHICGSNTARREGSR
jgi:hypothetical protein